MILYIILFSETAIQYNQHALLKPRSTYNVWKSSIDTEGIEGCYVIFMFSATLVLKQERGHVFLESWTRASPIFNTEILVKQHRYHYISNIIHTQSQNLTRPAIVCA